MRIGFFHLQFTYISLLDWTRIWRWLGERLFPVRLKLLYDGNCELCRRTMAMVRTLDILGRVEYLNSLDRRAVPIVSTEAISDQTLRDLKAGDSPRVRPGAGAEAIPEETLLQDIVALEGARMSTGYDAYRRTSLRVPPLWPIVPFLYIPLVRAIGMKVYRHVADSRACMLPTSTPVAPNRSSERWWITATVAVGYSLMLIVSLCSIARFHSWPFAGYPTFEGVQVPRLEVLTARISTVSDAREVSVQSFADRLGIDSARLVMLTSRIIALPESADKSRRFCALWKEVSSVGQLPEDAKLTFYQDTISTYPEDHDKPPLERRVVFTTPGCSAQAR
jgi:predicted DCC family thiol-disulfide oxidoreductase YuxK